MNSTKRKRNEKKNGFVKLVITNARGDFVWAFPRHYSGMLHRQKFFFTPTEKPFSLAVGEGTIISLATVVAFTSATPSLTTHPHTGREKKEEN